MNLFQMKKDICEIGDRIYKRGFAAANDGNITYRVGENEVLCSPTMVCKGFLKPDDICLIDMTGKQLAGHRKRSSEALLHLEIMKARPDVKSVVHCHPPHATAFAIAREPIPQCVLPEVEVFLGEVPISRYETPGGKEFAETILPFVAKSNVIILANHGTVSFGPNVEQAFWYTEILDAYCRMLMMARSLGRVEFLDEQKSRELLDLKTRFGIDDPRLAPGMENCDICANDLFRESWAAAGIERRAFDAPPPIRPKKNGAPTNDAPPIRTSSKPEAGGPTVDDQEALVQLITDRVMAALQSGSSS
jgi:L-fuculose-phosphate aldolase